MIEDIHQDRVKGSVKHEDFHQDRIKTFSSMKHERLPTKDRIQTFSGQSILKRSVKHERLSDQGQGQNG